MRNYMLQNEVIQRVRVATAEGVEGLSASLQIRKLTDQSMCRQVEQCLYAVCGNIPTTQPKVRQCSARLTRSSVFLGAFQVLLVSLCRFFLFVLSYPPKVKSATSHVDLLRWRVTLC